MTVPDAGSEGPAQPSAAEPTNEQIRDRIDVIMARAQTLPDGSLGELEPGDRAELDQLWLLLRARDVGPEENGAAGSAW